jgi:hypothetical protein
MAAQLSKVRWGHILAVTAGVYLASFVMVFAVIFGYAFVLGFQARGMPDPAQIQSFANQIAPWGSRLGLVIFTVAGAAWVARRVNTAAQLHGILIGALVGAPNLVISRPFNLGILATIVLGIGAGWLGGWLGSRGGRA